MHPPTTLPPALETTLSFVTLQCRSLAIATPATLPRYDSVALLTEQCTLAVVPLSRGRLHRSHWAWWVHRSISL